MKNTISIIAIAMIASMSMNAQVQKDVQKKTTVKTVRVTDNNMISTKIIEDTDAEIDVIEVEGTDDLNQKAKVLKKDADKTEVIGGGDVENAKNKMMVANKKELQQKELEMSKKAMDLKAKKEKMALEQKKKEMMADLEKRRAALTKRPKGMAKLKKDPDGDGIE
ncbi:hypothetical protein G5B37_03045 [Rasiella rasia]|uniref:Uncharacterized protein n=1 Tax=Rasiella rasia TaxID=2744027 RepID=A0A6G6GJ94_9FLAO|nr:hypothetical protein [Rasiella rasia]QIE58570.1 hypothetical protein G5B37_03045 [Rasiella rasia]